MKGFLDELESGLRTVSTAAKAVPARLRAFLEQEVQTDFGPWKLAGHEPLLEIIDRLEDLVTRGESNSRVTVMKAEQIGFTTLALAFAVWLTALRHLNVGYFFPNDALASEWGVAKLNPFVAESAYLSGLVAEGRIDRGVLKDFGGTYLYLVGLNKIPTSRPMDFQLSDEVDLTSDAMRKWKRGRMRHSELRGELDFSAPYAQDSGIDGRYSRGSQRRMLYRCGACGTADICLEESFPECMREFNGKWIRVCPKCHRKLDVRSGVWVATYPLRETRSHGNGPNISYRISALSTGAIDGDEIMSSYNEAEESGDPDQMAIFNRSARALADAGSMQPFDAQTLERLATPGDWALAIWRPANPVFFGIDCGNSCWIWFEERLPTGQARLIYAEKMHSDKWVERTIELVRRFDARFGIADKYPYTPDSRRLAYALGSKIALLDFDNGRELDMVTERLTVDGTQGGGHVETGPAYLCIKVDRNWALSRFCAEAKNVDRGLIIPSEKTRTMEDVRDHLKKLQKVMDPDKAGDSKFRFIDHVDNHYGMAGMSASLAFHLAPRSEKFAGYFPKGEGLGTSGIPAAADGWGGLVSG